MHTFSCDETVANHYNYIFIVINYINFQVLRRKGVLSKVEDG